MRIGRLLFAGLALAAMTSSAQAGVRLGIGIGIGIPCYPCYRPYYYGYPYPVYVAPAPVVIAAPPAVVAAPAPVVVGSASAAVPAPVPASAPAPTPVPESASASVAPPPPPEMTTASVPPLRPVARSARPSIGADLGALNDPDAKVRGNACVRLGRLKDDRAVQPLVRVLKEDSSPAVREAAARGLGLIAAPSSLSALQTAAQADDDRDVRRSASFAAEIIRANLRR
jgi:hypothetical protein